MISFNKFVLQGTIGHIEQREQSGDRAMTTVVLYVDDDYYSENDGAWVDRSYRFPVTFFGQRANSIFDMYVKGDVVIVEGKLTQTVVENNGQNEYRFYFNGDNILRISRAPLSEDEIEERKERKQAKYNNRSANTDKSSSGGRSNGNANRNSSKSTPRSKWNKKKANDFVDEEYDVDVDLDDIDFDNDE